MFITDAYAQSAGGGSSSLGSIMIPMVLMIAIFYFLLIRPQQKRAKEHKALIDGLQKGDKVVAAGGLIGKVTKISTEQEIEIEMSTGTQVTVLRESVTNVVDASNRKEVAGKAPTKANKAKKAAEEATEEVKGSLKDRFNAATNKK